MCALGLTPLISSVTSSNPSRTADHDGLTQMQLTAETFSHTHTHKFSIMHFSVPTIFLQFLDK